ncbi:alkaline phosphatase D family protein [Rubinisphaera sp.]|uniref:alkaline phosphatase D family protein n=1 Tax=Rubinisphaera sp. TaxID=2024857 RepID=UPI000C10F0FC|nr:alkaline phosphatase D family protein [Rubinisphaera sp.]MBV09171.1 alkaline phosphatase [Rubinisphaera sp.]HCS54741.1 alkaline phosphatase [Planctomycetaceae bacterium]|tara:strand:+ start:3361 stop:4818 length:1458 start_codon:yes stop_codon:yes gene_type:complete
MRFQFFPYYILSFAILICAGERPAQAVEIFHAQGEMAGEVTATSVLLQSRLTEIPGPVLDPSGDITGKAGLAKFEWSIDQNFSDSKQTDWLKAEPESDFIVRAELTNLKPGTQYYYRLHYGTDQADMETGPVCSFRTLNDPETAVPLKFCMGSCMNYHSFMSGKSNGGGPVTATEEDRKLGYPVFEQMLKLEPEFFIGTGDIVYYDHPGNNPAKTLPELRQKWHEQFRFPRLIKFFSQTPAYWSKDDHDFRYNDADLKSNREPSVEVGIDLFREQMPIHPAGEKDKPTYRTHRVNKHLQLWFVEGRDYRSPNKAEDGPEKTIWGAEQKAWLQKTLLESDATWKILISPTPMVGPDSARKTDNHTNLGGFRAEAEEFFNWLNEHQINLINFCGDRHWQYHSIHPQGVEEFSCGALNDENSIMGSFPGQKNSTDPEGLIKQPYHYKKPTGGFLFVQVEPETKKSPPKLIIESIDDEGTVLNRVVKEK